MRNIPVKHLTVFDCTCIIVGIIIGAGIYETTPAVALGMGSAFGTLGIWFLGGMLALAGALCYAQLATMFPHQGGDYIYLSRAYGRGAGFLFGWSQLIIIRPGDIALMAFIFARYASHTYSFSLSAPVYAFSSIFILTAINILGVRQGKWTQNVLTMVKLLGLVSIFAAAMFVPDKKPMGGSFGLHMPGIQLSLILVLYTYGGWNEIAYVAAEVKDSERNIMRALILGTLAVMMIYLLVNLAFLLSLGYPAVACSQAVAVDALSVISPQMAGRLISALICISSLGAINGLIFTGGRISYALGQDHLFFRKLGQWNLKRGIPLHAILLQGILSLIIVLAAGSFIDTILYTAPAVWLFFTGTAFSLFILRKKTGQACRDRLKIKCLIAPIVFCLMSLFMLYNSGSYAMIHKPVGFIVMAGVFLPGIIVYHVQKWIAGRAPG